MSKKRPVVLVTGAGGQLGQTLKKHHSNNKEVTMVSVSSADLDITDPRAVAAIFKKYQPDYCINCAAYTNVKLAEKEVEKAYQVNAEAAGQLARICEEHQCVLLHLSTDYVFDGKKQTPYTIQDQPAPLNVYGSSKLEGEKQIAANCSRYYIVRTSWLYSKEFGKNFYRTILNNAMDKKPMSIITSQRGTPTNTVNLANYLMNLIISEASYGLKHFSDEQVMSWYEFAVKILEEHQLDISLLTAVTALEGNEVERPLYSALTSKAG